MHKPNYFYAQASNDTIVFWVVGVVGDWWDDLDSAGFIRRIESAKREGYKTIHVKINSPGGSVFEGLAIYNALQSSGLTIITEIVGIAASMGAILFLAGSKRIMPTNALLMVHAAWTVTQGNAQELRQIADDMDKIDTSLNEIIQQVTGCTDEQLGQWMSKDTWMNAEESKTFAFATETVKPNNSVEAPKNSEIKNLSSEDLYNKYYASLKPDSSEEPKPKNHYQNLITKTMNFFQKMADALKKGDVNALDQIEQEMQNAQNAKPTAPSSEQMQMIATQMEQMNNSMEQLKAENAQLKKQVQTIGAQDSIPAPQASNNNLDPTRGSEQPQMGGFDPLKRAYDNVNRMLGIHD